MLTGPLFMLQIYDRVLASQSMPTLMVLTFLVGALFVFLGLFELIRSRLLARVAKRIDEQVHAPLFGALINRTVKGDSDHQSQPLRDLEVVRQFLSGPSPSTLFDIPWTPIYLAIIFILHFYLGIFATIGAVLLVILAFANDILTRNTVKRAHSSVTMSHKMAEECRRNAGVIRGMGMLPELQARWQQYHHRALQDQVSASDRNGFFSSLAKSIRLFLQSAMLALGAYLAINQEITAGAIIAGSIIMARALAPIEQGITHWRGYTHYRQAYQRLDVALEDYESYMPKMDLPSPKGYVAAEKLSVFAPGTKTPIIRNIQFRLAPGQAMGIIGPTGAGKSTLARALSNVWPASSGKVTLDGAPLHQWDPNTLGRFVGYLPQDVELFDGTFDENIARFRQDGSPEDIITAAKLAQVHDLILSFPDGYKTNLGEGGVKLSAGQRQRIGLARALYGNPVFLVMDEPNANLDAEGEAALTKVIRTLKAQGTTIVVIAHRPSAVAAVDFLLVLNDGRQQDFGPRDEVLKTNVTNGAAHKNAALSPTQLGSQIQADPQHV